jgi:hypothetical protein
MTEHVRTRPPPPERIDSRRTALAWTTIARAERLAQLGAGWSADHVMRRALACLERRHFGRRAR